MKSNYSRAIPREMLDWGKLFMAIGDDHRQRILRLFTREKRLNVGQIAEAATITRSSVSYHLKILKDAGVLQSEKVGKEVYYWINKQSVEKKLRKSLDLFVTSY